MKSKEIPIFYLFIYRHLRKKANGRPFITHTNLFEILKRVLNKVPNPLKYEVIRELEEFNLIKKINKRKYQLTGGRSDLKLNKFDSFF